MNYEDIFHGGFNPSIFYELDAHVNVRTLEQPMLGEKKPDEKEREEIKNAFNSVH